MTGLAIVAALALALGGQEGPPPSPSPSPTAAAGNVEKDWKDEFTDVCGRTQDAMSIPVPELRDLIRRCDTLRARIEDAAEPERKVYRRRLKQCRELYEFMVESRARKGPS